MLPIRIQCVCGQEYQFEVEPVDGRMPTTVACPVCGADGTVAANEFIAQNSGSQPSAPVAPSKTGLHLAPHPASNPGPGAASGQASPRRGAILQHWQTDRTQAKFEAKARISWGDSPRDVLGYLMSQGFNREEASEIVEELKQGRAMEVRTNGIKNIVFGSGLILLPIVSFVIFLIIGVIPLKIFAFMIIGGFYGIWLVIKGTHMLISPKSESGDVAEQ